MQDLFLMLTQVDKLTNSDRISEKNSPFKDSSQINFDVFDDGLDFLNEDVDFVSRDNRVNEFNNLSMFTGDVNAVITDNSTCLPLPSDMFCFPNLSPKMDYISSETTTTTTTLTTTTLTTNTSYNFSPIMATVIDGESKQRGAKRMKINPQRCIKCETSSTFGLPFTKKPLYCDTHKPLGCVDVVHSRCQENRCDKRAYYGIKGTTKRACREHKLKNYIPLSRRFCTYTMFGKECEKQARYGPLFKRKLFCLKHKTDNDHNVVRVKCVTMIKGFFDDTSKRCKNRPIYTKKGQNHPLRCEIHKEEFDVEIFDKHCHCCHEIHVIPSDNTLCISCDNKTKIN